MPATLSKSIELAAGTDGSRSVAICVKDSAGRTNGATGLTRSITLDTTALRNLEILEPLHRDAPRNTSLYGALNKTVTPMGARRLRDWLSQPLASVPAIWMT